MESVSPDLIEQPEALQLVLNRVFHFRELQLNPRHAQGLLGDPRFQKLVASSTTEAADK